MQTKQVVMYNVPRRSDSGGSLFVKKRLLRHTENKFHVLVFISQIISKNICEYSLSGSKDV